MGEKEPPPARERLQATVHGHVHGVGFRYHTEHRARDMGLVGYVRNLWDGSVEVVAEGPVRDVEDLLAFLYVGPRGAFVTQVDVRRSGPSEEFEHFEVRF